MVDRYAARRAALRAIVHDRTRAPEERFDATLLLAKLPRNSAKVRVRNRCALTGRPRGFHRKFGMSRIAVRDLGSAGQIPGLVKASW
jgi:small subunit ribosomal protein S14